MYTCIFCNNYYEKKSRGYQTNRDLCKWEQFNFPLRVLKKPEIYKIRSKQFTLDDLIGNIR